MSFNAGPILSYLSLSSDYAPSPADAPVEFLLQHLRQLPPALLAPFSSTTTPKQRTAIPTVRNRRLRYTLANPPELGFARAHSEWPVLWGGSREPRGREEARAERQWADKEFLAGGKQHVGKLGALLGDYEEEREAERARDLRREHVAAAEPEFVPEEESDDGSDEDVSVEEEQETREESQANFERLIRERFIYGLLEGIDYDSVDWNDVWDEQNDRDEEERWFDEEDED